MTLRYIARDNTGRSVSALARAYNRGTFPHSFMGGDPNTITFLVTSGMSQKDANFIADYAPIDKAVLVSLITGGMSPYDALTKMYGGAPYMPNVDSPPLNSYIPPSYAPLPGWPKGTSAPLTVPALPATGALSIPATIFGIPTLYVGIAGAAGLYFMMRNRD